MSSLPLHIDMRAGLLADGGELVIQQYLGTAPRRDLNGPRARRPWVTGATFEAPADGELAYLNEVVALGVGWVKDGTNDTRYEYRIWC